MTDVPPKPRARTSRMTWAVAVAFVVLAIAGGIWGYFTLGAGRTVDASGIKAGMTFTQVEETLGEPDEVLESNGMAAWRYGRTHIWFVGVPGRGSIVTEVTDGPGEPVGQSKDGPKMKGPGMAPPNPGGKWKGRPDPGQPKAGDAEK